MCEVTFIRIYKMRSEFVRVCVCWREKEEREIKVCVSVVLVCVEVGVKSCDVIYECLNAC